MNNKAEQIRIWRGLANGGSYFYDPSRLLKPDEMPMDIDLYSLIEWSSIKILLALRIILFIVDCEKINWRGDYRHKRVKRH